MPAVRRVGRNNTSRHFLRLLAALAICWASSASAQDAALNGSRLTSGRDVRGAFTDVVASARQATVRVLVDGEPAALGAVVDADGWILTKGSDLKGELRCRLVDGRELAAEYMAYHSDTDLALLRVDADDLTAIEWFDESDPLVGQWLATPAHESAPVGVGIVSVPRRPIIAEKISGVLGVRLEDFEGAAKISRSSKRALPRPHSCGRGRDQAGGQSRHRRAGVAGAIDSRTSAGRNAQHYDPAR